MDTGHQALNLSAKNQARGGGGSSLRQSASTSSLGKLPQLPANVGAQSSPFDLLAAFGGDINSAVAAIAAASNAGLSGMDSANALAQLNAIAQLNQLAATNPKIAAAAMLQLQQTHLLTQQQQTNPPPPPLPPQLTSQHHLTNSSAQQLQHGVGGMGGGMGGMAAGMSGLGGVGGGGGGVSAAMPTARLNQPRYQQLLGIVDEMGREIRTCYLGNKNSIERLKRGIASARILVKDCQLECERNAKQ